MRAAELRTLHDVLLTDEEVATPRPVGFLVNAFLALVLVELMVTFVHPGVGLTTHEAHRRRDAGMSRSSVGPAGVAY